MLITHKAHTDKVKCVTKENLSEKRKYCTHIPQYISHNFKNVMQHVKTAGKKSCKSKYGTTLIHFCAAKGIFLQSSFFIVLSKNYK